MTFEQEPLWKWVVIFLVFFACAAGIAAVVK